MSHQVEDPAERFLARLSAIQRRFEALARRRAAGLTSPDANTGERWDAGQVWAHVAEFIPYWVAQAESVIAAGGEDPVRFGRTKTNPERIEAIERDRHAGPNALWQVVREDINDLGALLREMPDQGWGVRGRHETRGVMAMSQIIDEFLISHLEEHATQLEQVGSGATAG